MDGLQSRVEEYARERFRRGLRVIRVEDGLIFEHRNATHFLAEVDLRKPEITVPVPAEFRDHPEYSEDEIVDHAMNILRPRLRKYRNRGYEIREIEFQPAASSPYEETNVPIFVAFLERSLGDEDELLAELDWLLAQLPDK